MASGENSCALEHIAKQLGPLGIEPGVFYDRIAVYLRDLYRDRDDRIWFYHGSHQVVPLRPSCCLDCWAVFLRYKGSRSSLTMV